MILPRSGRTACVLRSRPCLAEPPAESPSTRNNSRNCGSRSEQSASLADKPSSSRPLLRVSSLAFRAASRACAARTHLSAIFRAVAGSSSKASASLSLTICWTRPFTSVLQRHLDLDVALLPFEEQHLGMDGRLVLVQVLDEFNDASLVEEGMGTLVALVGNDDLKALVQEGNLAQPIRE